MINSIDLQKSIDTLSACLARCDLEIQKISPQKLIEFKFLKIVRNLLKDKPTAKPNDFIKLLKKGKSDIQSEVENQLLKIKGDSTELQETRKKINEMLEDALKKISDEINSKGPAGLISKYNALAAELSLPIEKIAHEQFALAAFFAENLKTKETLGNILTADQLYNLYSWFKQAVFGDVHKDCPPLIDLTFSGQPSGPFAQFMWTEWKAKQGELRGLIQRNYIEIVRDIIAHHRKEKCVVHLCTTTTPQALEARCQELTKYVDFINDLRNKYSDFDIKANHEVVAYYKLATDKSKDEKAFWENANSIPEIAEMLTQKKKASSATDNNNVNVDNNNASANAANYNNANGSQDRKDNYNNSSSNSNKKEDEDNNAKKPSEVSHNNNAKFMPGYQATIAQATKLSEDPSNKQNTKDAETIKKPDSPVQKSKAGRGA